MEPAPRAIRHEELLAQMGWVQALARSLVRDPNVALDVAQQAVLTALERPPHTARSGPGLRAWLATVTRTLARQSARGESRRAARERRAARPEAAPATGDVVERGEAQQRVVEAVMKLDEPYRSTVLYRYLDGLSAPEIAERMDATPAAVRKRLSRGLEQMRANFDAEHGGERSHWIAALLPLVGRFDVGIVGIGGIGGAAAAQRVGASSASESAAATGTAAAGAWPLTLAGAGVIGTAVLAVVLVWRGGGGLEGIGAETPTSLGGGVPAVAVDVTGAGPTEVGQSPVQPLAARGVEPVDVREQAAAIDMPSRAVVVRGRVVDLAGRPVSGLRLRFEPDRQRANMSRRPATLTTLADDDGRFVFPPVTHAGRVLAASSHTVTVLAGYAELGRPDTEQTVVVAPRRRIAGHVLDERGAAIAAAEVELTLPAGWQRRFGTALDSGMPLRWRAETGVDGRFDLANAPGLEGALLSARAPGYEFAEATVPEHAALDLMITLVRPEVTLRGRVLHADGTPAPGARVSHMVEVVAADDGGWFELPLTSAVRAMLEHLGDDPRAHRLVAMAPDVQPAVMDAPLDGDGNAVWPNEIELRLGPAPLTMRGRIVGADGEPQVGLIVWVADPGMFYRNISQEGVLSTETNDSSSDDDDRLVVIESVLAGAPDEDWHVVSTDQDGRFELPGLLDRDYVVAAMDSWLLVRTASEPVHPSTGVTLTLDRERTIKRVTGRVVSRRGAPVVGAEVGIRTSAFAVGGSSWIDMRRGDVSGPDGEFVLEAVPLEGAFLRVEGRGMLPSDYGRAAGDEQAALISGQPIEIVVPLRLDVQVALERPDEADRVAFLDAQGQPVRIHSMRFARREERGDMALVEGRSPVFAVSDAAVVMILSREGSEVRRVALEAAPGRVNVVR